MNVCNYCKHLTDVNREVAPDKGWCVVWCRWQKTAAKACKYFEQKELPPRRGQRPRFPKESSRPNA